MLNPDELYDNAFFFDNVYGHALELLGRYKYRAVDEAAAATEREEVGVHLDIGCGFGRIAEPLTERLNLHYVGVDGAQSGLASLRLRGFEAHELMFEGFDQMLAGLRAILGGRRLASLSMLDTLEHLPNGDAILLVIRELIGEWRAPAVISVPNVGHRDVGFRLAFGQWEYTRDGLLDHTHTRLFSNATLIRTLNAAGLQVVDGSDVEIVKSDQNFPDTHPALADGSILHEWLSSLRSKVDDFDTVNQFVRLVLAGPRNVLRTYTEDEERDPKRPFLSIVTRTQGRRLHCLVEVFTSLAGQQDTDFEVLVLGHKLTVPQQKSIERVIEDCPAWLRARIRMVRVNDGNRTRPLNCGFEAAHGEYIVILDDDDVPMAHWVSTFRELANRKPGAILRTVAARQDVTTVSVRGHEGVRAIGGIQPYPGKFDLFEHIECNQSPPVGLAFPRGVFHDLKLRFDETLTTTEDWDFLLRAAFVVGVESSDQITSIYRWWAAKDESSRSVHDEREWAENYQAICRKIDSLPILLPPGAGARLRAYRLREVQGSPAPQPPNPVVTIVDIGEAKKVYLKEIAKILSSRSWRYTAIFRLPRRLRGKKDPRIADCLDMSEQQLIALLERLRRSTSLRTVGALRRRKSR